MNPSLPIYCGRFALLWHELPASQQNGSEKDPKNDCQVSAQHVSHWDLLLELDNGQLLTWRLPGVPLTSLLCAGNEFMADKLPNHRYLYLDYQGPISGNRGWVKRIAFGQYQCVVLAESEGGLAAENSFVSSVLQERDFPDPHLLAEDSGNKPISCDFSTTGSTLQIALTGQLNQESFNCLVVVQNVSESESRFRLLNSSQGIQ